MPYAGGVLYQQLYRSELIRQEDALNDLLSPSGKGILILNDGHLPLLTILTNDVTGIVHSIFAGKILSDLFGMGIAVVPKYKFLGRTFHPEPPSIDTLGNNCTL
jgi:hypothetical protein